MEETLKKELARKKLASIKAELKCWESMFLRGHGRKPNESDIASSGSEVKGAYKEYKQLKKELLEINSISPAGLRKATPEHETVKAKHEPKIIDEGTSEVFGTKLNKKGRISNGGIHNHIKDKSLANRHKLKFQPRRYLKDRIWNSTCSNDDKKSTSNISFDIKEADNNEVTNETKNETLQIIESTADGSNQDFDIITNQINDYQRNISSGKKGSSNRLSFNVSKSWLEKVWSSDKPSDGSVLEPFKTFEEEDEEHKNVIRNNGNASGVKNEREAIENLMACQEQNCAVRKNDFQAEKPEERSSFLDNNSQKKIEDHPLNADKFDSQVFSSDEQGKDLCNESTAASHDLKGSNGSKCVDKYDNTKSMKNKFLSNNNHENSVGMEKKKMSPKKRKEVGKEENENEIETSFDEGDINRVSKRMKKEDSSDSKAKVPKGRRLVSDNFVAIDIQKKRYHRGKRSIKGSTYKRQQWKKKSLYSSQNSSNCNQFKMTNNWVNNCRNISRGNPRKFSSNVGKKKDDFKPIHQSEEEAGCSTFWFDDIPDLARCWPRIPYHTTCSSPPVEPLFHPVDGKPPQDAIAEVNKALRTLGYSSFREGQENAVARIVSGLSTLLVLSTGSGKSLCYQLPAFLYYVKAKYLTIVISPLVALMEDQVKNLPYSIKGACFHTNMTKTQREKVIRDVASRKIAVLLLSPEALIFGSSSIGYLPVLRDLPPISFVCIDEAHCISEWSHNFRPSYLRVCKVLRDILGVRCFLGLTATSTKSTSLSVLRHLGISNVEIDSAIIKGSTMPDNLFITVSKDEDRDQALINLLTSQKWRKCTSVIIYCTRRDETERLSSLLRTCLQNLSPTKLDVSRSGEESPNPPARKKGNDKLKAQRNCIEWDADCYHAGMTPTQRKKVQMRFMTGNLRIVVATTAFGMGLDKANVRGVIHYNMPKSFESFLQEIGRAGRDGLPAYCHIFIDEQALDLCELRRHTYGNSIDLKTVKAFVNSVFKRCDCKDRLLESKNAKVNSAVCKQDAENDQLKGFADVHNSTDFDFSDEFSDIKALLDDVDETESRFQDAYDISDTMAHPQPRKNDAFNRYPSDNDADDKPFHLQSSDNDPLEFAKADIDSATRCCSGHHVTLSIEDTVLALDMREENIATLLSYLENLTNSSVLFMGRLQSDCTVRCYGGHRQMKMLAKRFLPMTAVFNRMKKENLKLINSNAITFNVVEIADGMGWDLDPIYHELRSLQWNVAFAINSNDSLIGKSGILVEFDNISFHVIAPGDLTDDERDDVCSSLYKTIKSHERSRLLQLDALFSIFDHFSKDGISTSVHDDAAKADKKLSKSIEEYFECDVSEMDSYLEKLTRSKVEMPVPEHKWNAISRDVRTLTSLHNDIVFNGRSLARIFHGIDSPCFPATIWGQDKRFWRRYLDVDFNKLCKFITAETVRFKI